MARLIHTNRLKLLAVLVIVSEYAPATMIPSSSHTTLDQYGGSNLCCTEHTALIFQNRGDALIGERVQETAEPEAGKNT
ncbi:hypothetical protein ASPBRDRAFT_578047 [Aspergillus brasiliensis CBS 101740]|uniref:Secreted protein n=1 Tax=Aspergillus brasiliensis (strain CBS 101740 / IMI 381727 / IBT 21946) TaxID=767769 RepID=A0A1L9UJI6_ASPBC|nr:hypothetical protein ASPBRDRAFT_578047 [Aspergillus brasiliensis CBS 101740]